MRTEESIQRTRDASRDARARGATVGVVPTMGALHQGHVSLMNAARQRCDFVITTIFVNPAQFGPKEDLDKYPRPLTEDLEKCRSAGVDFVFHPRVEEMYPANAQTHVEVSQLSARHDGAHRPGHFRGVTTVVTKLFNITLPDIAFFGQKDYQQQLIIRRMCRDLDIPVEIHTCPIIRDPDGLALSSRNRFLSPVERDNALRLFRSLQFAESELRAGQSRVDQLRAEMLRMLEHETIDVDYVQIVDAETLEPAVAPESKVVVLVAARVGTTRLIDNTVVDVSAKSDGDA